MKKLEDMSVTDQAYNIAVGLNGSWMYDALHVQLKEEEFCKQFVECWLRDEGVGEREQIEEFINWSESEATT